MFQHPTTPTSSTSQPLRIRQDVYHAPSNAELFQKRLRQMSPPEVRINGSDPVARRWRWRWTTCWGKPMGNAEKNMDYDGKTMDYDGKTMDYDGKTMEYDGKTMDYDGEKKVWENHPNRMDDSG